MVFSVVVAGEPRFTRSCVTLFGLPDVRMSLDGGIIMFRNALILLGALLGSLGAVTVSLAAESDDCECSCRDSRSSSEPALRQLLDEFLAGCIDQ